jgi:hypothetical protein
VCNASDNERKQKFAQPLRAAGSQSVQQRHNICESLCSSASFADGDPLV